ncbi:MAG: tetratricopeptide repeat protein [Acidobacteria bacterium]|nr:tetratricopeptide repeat protein [Acidobacteriota bacterium]
MTRRIELSRAVGAALLLVACSAPLAAQEAFFEEGNRLYQEGDFAGAVALYERILETGVESGELHYNLGNAWFRLGEMGPAVLHYERARRMMPRDDDLRANLELARSLTVDEITPLPGFWLLRVARWWIDLLSRPVLLAVVTLTWLTAMGALIVAVAGRAESLLAWSRRVAAVAGGLTLVFGLSLMARELGVGRPDEAVIMAAAAAVHSAPSDDRELLIFTVHEGTRVRVERRSDAWVEIVLEDGRVGWVRSGQLVLI